jgi:molybdate transport repressor ModE-like protein
MRNADGWGALEVRHVRAFAAVVDEGSFSAAARELGYTQSAVSQQIGALERIVGGSVLRRPPGGRRAPELTDTGRVVLAHARPLLARVKAAQADVASLAGGDLGQITVLTFQSFGARMLPTALRICRARCPRVEVRIEEALDADRLLGAVESGEVDISFASLPLPEGPFAARELCDDPYVLVTSVDSEVRSLDDLAGKRLLGIRGCRQYRLVELEMEARGVEPESISRFDDNAIIQALAAADEGVAIVPELVIDTADPQIAVHPLPELPARRLIAVWHRERTLSAAAHQFLDAASVVSARPRPAPAREPGGRGVLCGVTDGDRGHPAAQLLRTTPHRAPRGGPSADRRAEFGPRLE